MPSPRPTGHRQVPVHERLGLSVEASIRAYIEAIKSFIETRFLGEVQGLRNSLAESNKRLRDLEAQLETVKAEQKANRPILANLENLGADDKYVLTKAKLIEFMKAKGWYN